jgi:hypothetical protein
MAIRSPRSSAPGDLDRAFTLLEVALIVAIIGMMLLIIVGYLFAPKKTGPLPPIIASTPIPSSSTPLPALHLAPGPDAVPPPAAPSPGADVVPAAPAAATPQPSPSFR